MIQNERLIACALSRPPTLSCFAASLRSLVFVLSKRCSQSLLAPRRAPAAGSAAALFAVLMFSSARATELAPLVRNFREPVPVKVYGFFRERPQWTDATGKEVEALDFRFESVASNLQKTDVKSRDVIVSLKGAVTYPSEIRVKAPKNCSIGNTSVDNRDVSVFVNSRQIGDSFQIIDARPSSVSITFLAQGGYGQTTGTVLCKVRGEFRYSY